MRAAAFNPRFQGISIASDEDVDVLDDEETPFQSPFSGDLDCERKSAILSRS